MAVSPLIATFFTLGADVPQSSFKDWAEQLEALCNVNEAGIAANVSALSDLSDDLDAVEAALAALDAFDAPTRQIFTSSGTYTKPAGLTRVKATIVAGGGAGCGAAATAAGQWSVGFGGASGGVTIKWIEAADLGPTETVTIGAGGTPALGANGGAGGTTTFTVTGGADLVATGGAGGTLTGPTAATVVLYPSESAPGVGSGGDINLSGQYAATCGGGVNFQGGSSGGAGPFSGGGRGRASYAGYTNNPGIAADGYGGGGGGASNHASSSAQLGGAGAPGIVIIEEYYGS